MCGIAAIFSRDDEVAQQLYEALIALQHRGQNAVGILTVDQQQFYHHRGAGLARDVFSESSIQKLQGATGLAHVRYATSGNASQEEIQPMYTSQPYGIALVHNGNITNTEHLKKTLAEQFHRHMNTESDSEVLLAILAEKLSAVAAERQDLNKDSIFDAVQALHQKVAGSYAAIAVIQGKGLIGFRDPYGIRPMVIGSQDQSQGKSYMLASETAALDALGYVFERDVAPGEAIFIDQRGQLYSKHCSKMRAPRPCAFEYVYIARADSVIDSISVYDARVRMGQALAKKIAKMSIDIDVVIPIPSTSRITALAVAEALSLPYREGFVKNNYVGRTFMIATQAERERSVCKKLSAIKQVFANRKVLLVDDSIVRGTTCKQIIAIAKAAGAEKVCLASAAPAIRYPNVYGIDMPLREELIAHQRSLDHICRYIGADSLIYQELSDFTQAILGDTQHVQSLECSIFDGHYIVGDIDEQYLDRLSKQPRNSLSTR